MSQKQYTSEVLIIGAGPAGLMCAMYLAKHGISSLLIDKEVFPRNKTCGGAVSGNTLWAMRRYDPELIEDFFSQDFVYPCKGISFIAPNLNIISLPFQLSNQKHPAGFTCKRDDFDNFLLQKALQYKEINFLESHHVKTYNKTSSGFAIEGIYKNEPFHISTNLLVDAQGAYSNFSRLFLKRRLFSNNSCLGVRGYFKRKTHSQEQHIELYFLKELLPCYFWIFDLPNDMCNVGFGILSNTYKKNGLHYKELFIKLIKSYPLLSERFVFETDEIALQTHMLPLGGLQQPLSGQHFMLTGDAAALIDPFTGEGIGNAMISGLSAAETIIHNFENKQCYNADLTYYDKLVQKRLSKEIRLSYQLQQFSKYSFLFNIIANKSKRSKRFRNFLTTMFTDIESREKLRNPFFYIKSLF